MSTTVVSPLIDKKVILMPVQNNNVSAMFKDAKYENNMMTGTTRTIKVPIDKNSGTFIEPLTEEEKEYFEDRLGLVFDIYKDPSKCYWAFSKAKLKLRKVGKGVESAAIVLDLNNPFDYLHYKMCLVNNRVANNWSERIHPEIEFVLKDIDAEYIEELDFTKVETEVLEYLIKNKSNYKALYDFSRLFGLEGFTSKKPVNGSTTDWLYTELMRSARDKKNIALMSNILKLNPKVMSLKIFVEDAIDAAAILRRGSKYTIEGVDADFYSVDELTAFLEEKKNQDIKLRIASLTKAKNKE